MLPFLKLNAMGCKSLQRGSLTMAQTINAINKLIERLEILQVEHVKQKLVEIAKLNRDSTVAMFIDSITGVLTRSERAEMLEEDLYIRRFLMKFDDMMIVYRKALQGFLEAVKESGSEYVFVDVNVELTPEDAGYEMQKKVIKFLEFKGLTMKEFKKHLCINTVMIESGFSTMKFVKNRLRSKMSDETLELNLIGYLNKPWLYSLSVDDIVEDIMKTKRN